MINFEKNLNKELNLLRGELLSLTYHPQAHKCFIICDPKTRTIHSSTFRDRLVHHALVNILEPIFEKRFIYDSYAGRKKKGALKAVQRFNKFKRKVSQNGRLVKKAHTNNDNKDYALKADIKHYFEAVDHQVLIEIIQRKIKDEKVICLIKKILKNYKTKRVGRGMPLGNLTSQFFANVYLNELDYFIKHKLKIKYYIRYVDDFVILEKERKELETYKEQIATFLREDLKIELHPEKSSIFPLRKGITFLGYRIFYHYTLLRKRNKRSFDKKFVWRLELYKKGFYKKEELFEQVYGWFGYARWANTYALRNKILETINSTKIISGPVGTFDKSP